MTITTSPRSLLELSDERDTALQLRLAAYREGHALSAQEQWAAGYAAAIGDVKREQHELVRGVQLEAARSAPGGAAWPAPVARNGGTEYGGRREAAGGGGPGGDRPGSAGAGRDGAVSGIGPSYDHEGRLVVKATHRNPVDIADEVAEHILADRRSARWRPRPARRCAMAGEA